MSEKVLQTLVIGVDVTFVPNQIVSLHLQGVHNSCKLKIMGRVALLMVLQLVRSISYNCPILHQNIAGSLSRCITIDHKVLLSGNASIGVVVSLYFNPWKLCSHSGVHSNSLVFFNRLVIGLAILQEFSMKRR